VRREVISQSFSSEGGEGDGRRGRRKGRIPFRRRLTGEDKEGFGATCKKRKGGKEKKKKKGRVKESLIRPTLFSRLLPFEHPLEDGRGGGRRPGNEWSGRGKGRGGGELPLHCVRSEKGRIWKGSETCTK